MRSDTSNNKKILRDLVFNQGNKNRYSKFNTKLKLKIKVTLLNGSNIHFNNNVILRLNKGSKILINNGALII